MKQRWVQVLPILEAILLNLGKCMVAQSLAGELGSWHLAGTANCACIDKTGAPDGFQDQSF